MTTSPQLSKDIEKYMEGVKPILVWAHTGQYKNPEPGVLEDIYRLVMAPPNTILGYVPAYTLEDILKRLPDKIVDYKKSSEESFTRIIMTTAIAYSNIGYRGKVLKKIKYDNENVSLTEAAGTLLKELGEEGYLN